MCFEFFRYKYEDSRWFHENVSKMTAHFNGRNETEALLRFCLSEFFVRKALYFKYKPYFPCEMAEDSPAVRWALFTCVSLFFFSICRFAKLHREVKYRRYHVFLFYKLAKSELEIGSQQTPYYEDLV